MTPFLDDLDSCSLKGLRLSLFFSFLIFFFAWLVGGASVSASWPGAAVLLRGATVCARAPPEASGRRSRGPRRAVAGFHQSSGARGRACSRGEGGESGVLRPLLPSSPLLGDLCRGFSGTGVGHSGRGDISPFPDIRVVSVDAPRKGCLDLPEGRASYPLPFYAVSFFFLPLLQIATELRVRGSSPLMFTLLLSNFCVAALKAFGRGRAKLQLHGRLCYFCV